MVEDDNITEKYEEFEKNHKQIKIEDKIFSFEPFCTLAKTTNSLQANNNKESLVEQIQQAANNKIQIMRLCHMLIFYTNLVCEEVSEEPIQKAGD